MNIPRVQVDMEWYQIPTWATKNKYEIRTIQAESSFEAYDPSENVIYYPRPKNV
jgi:hypothetical protein